MILSKESINKIENKDYYSEECDNCRDAVDDISDLVETIRSLTRTINELVGENHG